MDKHISSFMKLVESRNSGEKEFLQAVLEVSEVIIPFIQDNKKYQTHNILERLVEPERTIIFRVPWQDDSGNIQVNRGYRVEFNSAIGPYKGGLRFHPSVNLSILKFLGFEQVFKNSLTSLPLGGGKGGSDFDPKGKSESDLTGKGINWGGSLIRPEATGYGNIYFAQSMLNLAGETFDGKTVVISGSGNVAQYSCEKAIELGAKVVSFSDSSGYIYDPDGINEEKLEYIKELKNIKRGRIKEYAKKFGCKFSEGKPWQLKCDIALPCATQNELNLNDAKALVSNGCIAVSEGANMPCTSDAINHFQSSNVLYAPGKASNAGGVATSGLEMSQNSLRMNWTREEVDQRLKEIMFNIHSSCVEFGRAGKTVDYVKGANIAGFVKVADAMIDQGIV